MMKAQYSQVLIYIVVISIALSSCISTQERALIKHISRITTVEEFQKLPDSTQIQLSNHLYLMFKDYISENLEYPSGLELENYIPSHLPKGIKNFYSNNLTNFSIKDYYYSYTDTIFSSSIYKTDTCTYVWELDTSFFYENKDAFFALYPIAWEGGVFDTVICYTDSISCNKIDCKVCEYANYLHVRRYTVDIDSMVIYYHNFPIFASSKHNIPRIDCEGINDICYTAWYVSDAGNRFFDRKKRFYYNEKLKENFYSGWINICNSFESEKGYEAIMWMEQNWNIERPRVILYKYDKEKGFSIGKSCHDEYAKYYNDYMEELRKYVENFCTKHNLSKIVFGAYVLVKKEN